MMELKVRRVFAPRGLDLTELRQLGAPRVVVDLGRQHELRVLVRCKWASCVYVRGVCVTRFQKTRVGARVLRRVLSVCEVPNKSPSSKSLKKSSQCSLLKRL